MQVLLSRSWSERPEERPTFSEIFDTLSKDMSYFSENVDEEEIEYYIDMLLSLRNEQQLHDDENKKRQEKISKLESEVNELKANLKKSQEEHKKNLFSDSYFHYGLASILSNKNSRNVIEGMNDLKISSSNGNCFSLFIVGLLYESGEEIKQEMNESFKYYERSFEQGNTYGIYRIGNCDAKGIGLKQNYNKAFEFYEKVAKLGNGGAMV